MRLVLKEPEITLELIYSKLSDYDIYRYYLNTDIKIGVAFCNTLRRDKQPSMVIYVGQSGHLFHRDYADDRFKGGPIDLVMQAYPGMNYDGALKRVASDFGITDALSEEYRRITDLYVKPHIDIKRHALIQVHARPWEKSDFDNYWNAYKVIGIDKLRKHDVYASRDICLNRKKLYIGKREMVFCYRYREGWKIMFPERKKTEKWISNIPLDMPEGLGNLSKNHNTLIVKSKKCLMVVEEIYEHVCSVQNESLGAVSESTAAYIDANSARVFYGGDSDEPGKKASYKITEKYKWNHINTPDNLLPAVKDWSDWVREDSLKAVEKHFKNKGLI